MSELKVIQAQQGDLLGRVKTDLYNGDEPNTGLVARLVAMLSREETQRGRTWTRSQKLALASILVPVMMVTLGWFTVQVNTFIGRVNHVTTWYDHHEKEFDQK